MYEPLTSPFAFGFNLGVLASLISILIISVIKDIIKLIRNKLQQNAKKE